VEPPCPEARGRPKKMLKEEVSIGLEQSGSNLIYNESTT